MADNRNLTHAEAKQRASLLDVTAYDIALDLADGAGGPGSGTFRSITTVMFTCSAPGADTFIEVAAQRLHRATLNGKPVDLAGWNADSGLRLSGLAPENELVIAADFAYSSQGQGLHRAVDPADQEVYLYSQFETADAQRVFACFDQPDLKSVFTWHARVPKHWKVISNAQVASEEPDPSGGKLVHFAPSARMSTYVTALCAGPYHEERTVHDGVDLGALCRRSMAQYLEMDEIFEITKQGFDFFQREFGVRYPLPKYDQLWVPEFNAGAMENFGCVVHTDMYLFRSAVTGFEREQRANTILHELAHMWFGDLVTMRWWDDLWLNESFAEWASHWCNSEATRFSDAWTTFLSLRKNWGYMQDQLSSTHPVYCEMPDVAAVEVNFDGITYAKGASVIKQLVAYVGIDAFLAGLREYFSKHAWGNATFSDLLGALTIASGRDLDMFAATWLETAEVNTLRPIVSAAADGTYAKVVVQQEAPATHPTLRPHRLGLGLYDLAGDRLVRRELLEIDVAGAQTPVDALAGKPAADVLLLNDDDLTYAKLRMDDQSLATVVNHLGGFESSLTRALCWAAAWDMVRDAEMASRDYVALVCRALPQESDINLVTTTLRQVVLALTQYVAPDWAEPGWAQLAGTARTAMDAAAPGGELQLAWARGYLGAARDEQDLSILRGWLNNVNVPAGLTITGELRWMLVQALAALDVVGADDIVAEHKADKTAAGDVGAATALALLPDAARKAAVWTELTTAVDLPNWRNRALTAGFQHPAHTDLTRPFMPKFFESAAHIWKIRDSEPAQEFLMLGYPMNQVAPETVAAAEEWLADESQPAPLRRLIAEGNDRMLRAQRARARDAAS